jgi:hypothetical protein
MSTMNRTDRWTITSSGGDDTARPNTRRRRWRHRAGERGWSTAGSLIALSLLFPFGALLMHLIPREAALAAECGAQRLASAVGRVPQTSAACGIPQAAAASGEPSASQPGATRGGGRFAHPRQQAELKPIAWPWGAETTPADSEADANAAALEGFRTHLATAWIRSRSSKEKREMLARWLSTGDPQAVRRDAAALLRDHTTDSLLERLRSATSAGERWLLPTGDLETDEAALANSTAPRTAADEQRSPEDIARIDESYRQYQLRWKVTNALDRKLRDLPANDVQKLYAEVIASGISSVSQEQKQFLATHHPQFLRQKNNAQYLDVAFTLLSDDAPLDMRRAVLARFLRGLTPSDLSRFPK